MNLNNSNLSNEELLAINGGTGLVGTIAEKIGKWCKIGDKQLGKYSQPMVFPGGKKIA